MSPARPRAARPLGAGWPAGTAPPRQYAARERGLVLISALLLLVVVTILAVGMFRSFGLDEKIAGNTREKGRALQAAESAQQYAEWWLSQANGSSGITCSSVVTATVGQVCVNMPASFTTLPWTINTAPVGVTYQPPNMVLRSDDAVAAGTYYATPSFYITFLGLTPAGDGNVYQVDAVGYGGSPSAVAVVESSYAVVSGVKNADH